MSAAPSSSSGAADAGSSARRGGRGAGTVASAARRGELDREHVRAFVAAAARDAGAVHAVVAARIAAAADRMRRDSIAREAAKWRPLELAAGDRVRVSFTLLPAVRALHKSTGARTAMHWSRGLYVVQRRRQLHAGYVVYDLRAVEGHAPEVASFGRVVVELPAVLEAVPRTYLRPVPSAPAPSFGQAHATLVLASPWASGEEAT